MATIKAVKARKIIDSRADETLEVDIITDDGKLGRASVPSGASTGKHEAYKIEDIDKAIANVKSLESMLIGQDPTGQERIDLSLLAQDGTPEKSNLGANVLLAISVACCEAGAQVAGKPLYQYIHDISGVARGLTIPTPLFNTINGGKHADNNLEFQEFMVIPANDDRPFAHKLKLGADLFNALKKLLHGMGHTVAVGDEGGFAPRLHSNEEALEILVRTIESSPYVIRTDVSIGLDVAASAIPDLSPVTFPLDPNSYFIRLVHDYPISFLEDPLPEDDWNAWAKLTEATGSDVLVVGDDLYTTNPNRLKIGIERKATNAIILMPDQIGTLTETFKTAKMAQEAGMEVMISHRSGETESTFISDLAVGLGATFIKSGAPSRGERVAKYNRLLRIEEELTQ